MPSTRCCDLYEVLAVGQDATAAQIKKSYHALALKWHPDKNADDAAATEMFKQVQEAYEVLADPQERAYYDDNRDELLASDDEADDEKDANEAEAELDLYRWMSRDAFVDFTFEEDGFFAVYSGVFRELDEQEKTARYTPLRRPGFGGAGNDVGAVTDFYAYWLDFATVRSDGAFAKHDKWDLGDAPSPLMRRLMQQKNKAVRDRARKMFNDKVRRLARWVKSQDPRPCGHVASSVAEQEATAQEEAAAGGADERGTFTCVACNKCYKSAVQLSNHEKSGKHKAMVAKLKKQLEADVEGCKELEELAIVEDVCEEAAAYSGSGARADGGAAAGEEAHSSGGARGGARVTGGGGGGGKKKKKKGCCEEDEAAEEDLAAEDDAAIEQAVASTALPSPGLVALQTRQAFESTDEFKKMNKTQRRKALLQWEAENEHIMEALRAEGKEPKAEPAAPKEKKPEAPARKEKVHGSGAHSREIKTPKKKKAVYMGGGNSKVVEIE